MKRNPIGGTDLSVTALSFGCSGIGNMFRKVEEAEAQAVLEHAWTRGIRYFDTAPHYGRGLSEQRLGAFLRGRPRDEIVISTKVGRLLSPGPAVEEADGFVEPLPNAVRFDYSGDGIEASFEQSCERLGTSRVDIVYVHDIGRYAHGEAENARHMADLMGSGLDRIRRLREQGRIRAFGLGVNETQVCLDIMAQARLDVILLAGRLTLLDRSAEQDLVPACRRAGTSLVLGGIFNSGILATGAVPGATYDYAPAPQDVMDRVAALEREAAAQGRSLAEAALRFALDHPAAASVLLGTAKVSSLERNLAMVAA
ncbi:aldo/keto reductase [Rubellimicrobium arenae]|uniref:aldo/keto reductase n=1 Tax=Rubellimicrobium arenae TaxID=2817372 RepID=UPI001B30F82C|nr:aldo/keto reductase [Rubellimicrobium arenae]